MLYQVRKKRWDIIMKDKSKLNSPKQENSKKNRKNTQEDPEVLPDVKTYYYALKRVHT